MPARLHGVVERADLRFLLEPIVDRIVRVVLHEAFDDMLLRPARSSVVPTERPRSNTTRIRAGQLDRPADPPAASGGGVERVLAVAIVAQHADASVQAARRFDLGHRFDEERLQPRNARLVGAGLLREVEELVAMIEREREHLVARRARRGDAMQPRQRRVLVGTRNPLRRWR